MPTITASYNNKTSNSINIIATGRDGDGDKLTYRLYVSTDGVNWGTVKYTLSNQTQGEKVILTANSLTPYTYYYWRVDVTDEIATASTERQEQVRTYCAKVSTCPGPKREMCMVCLGKGYITAKCRRKLGIYLY